MERLAEVPARVENDPSKRTLARLDDLDRQDWQIAEFALVKQENAVLRGGLKRPRHPVAASRPGRARLRWQPLVRESRLREGAQTQEASRALLLLVGQPKARQRRLTSQTSINLSRQSGCHTLCQRSKKTSRASRISTFDGFASVTEHRNPIMDRHLPQSTMT